MIRGVGSSLLRTCDDGATIDTVEFGTLCIVRI